MAGCSIAGRVTGIAGIAITSFSSAAVVFAGQEHQGAGNYRRLQRGVVQITCAARCSYITDWPGGYCVLPPAAGLFSSDPAVLDAAVLYTWWVLPFIWTYAVFNCMMSFVNGTGAVKYTTVVNLLILWAVRIPAAYILHALGVRHFLHGLRFPQLCRGPGGHARLFFDPGMGQTAPQSKGTGGRGDGGNRTDTVNIKSIKVCGELPK